MFELDYGLAGSGKSRYIEEVFKQNKEELASTLNKMKNSGNVAKNYDIQLELDADTAPITVTNYGIVASSNKAAGEGDKITSGGLNIWTYEASLEGKGVVKHENKNGTGGYWAGIGIPVGKFVGEGDGTQPYRWRISGD